jgi:glycosyltransferase involved in cell wall biosynthesis
VILEARNYGLPVISTQTPGPLELIEEGHTGLLTPVRDPNSFAARLREILAATDRQRASLGEAGRAYLNVHFGKSAIVGAYLNLYDRLSTEVAA